MMARRALMLCAWILGLALLLPTSVVPASAATCRLSVPTTVKVGTPIAIVGSGFPAFAAIDVSIGLEHATPDQLAVESDRAGAFTISLTPEPADEGRTTVHATAGTACSVQAVFTVTSASVVPTPVATPSPHQTGAGATSGPPPTDAAPTTVGQVAIGPTTLWVLALVILLIGCGGVMTTRRIGQR